MSAPATLQADRFRLAVFGCGDHPQEYAAGPASPGMAYGLDWVEHALAGVEADAVLVTPHWGPNMAAEPRLAAGEDAEGIRDRFTAACRRLGTEVRAEAGRLVASLR